MATPSHQRLMTKVAQLYYEQDVRQADIAARLELSQSRVSRLLKQAQREGIVRTTVSVPHGVFPELEERLQLLYGLREAIVVDCDADDDNVALRNIGAAGSRYLETTVGTGEIVGISSWSETLLAMVDGMQPVARPGAAAVVQLLGGVGNPGVEAHATHMTRRLTELVGGEAHFLPAPGVAGSADSRAALLGDPFVASARQWIDRVTLALVGIGLVEPSEMLARSGNVFTEAELADLRALGAVGDICMRFFDGDGLAVGSALDDRVIGMDLDQLQKPKRTVGLAGGPRKLPAIRAALRGRLVNVLITDRFTATRLAGDWKPVLDAAEVA